jgi:glycine cleavage system H protein
MGKKIGKSQKEESCYRLIPEKELKCVWMTAGLLFYKLCKYDFQCEKCPLDWELRNLSFTPPFNSIAPQEGENMTSTKIGPTSPWERDRMREELLKEDLSVFNIKESLFYHPGHTWIKVEKADEVRVGLDCFLGRVIGEVKVVILPSPGSWGLQGENLCSIINEEGILNTIFPISGFILSVNPKLKDQPELITRDPLGDGFLLTLKPNHFQRDQKYLFCGEAALSWYRKEWERFKKVAVSELQLGEERLGMTMQDGEINIGDVKKMINPEQYIQLISTFLRNGEIEFLHSKKRECNSKFPLRS